MSRSMLLKSLVLGALGLSLADGAEPQPAGAGAAWPLIVQDDFESDPFARWEPADKSAWKHEKTDRGMSSASFSMSSSKLRFARHSTGMC